MDRNECLNRAGELINGQRAKDYGDPFLNHRRIADFWNAYLAERNVELNAVDVALMMMMVKTARLMNTWTDDSFVDMSAYAALACEMSQVEDR